MFASYRAILRSPLARKLIRGLSIFGVVAVIIVSLIQYVTEFRTERGLLESQLQSVKQQRLAAINQSTWSTNKKEVSLQLEGLVTNSYIEYASIDNGSGIWVSAGKKLTANLIKRTYPLSYTQKNHTYNLGTLVVEANLEKVWSDVQRKTLSSLWSNLALILLISGFIFIILNQLVTRHLIDTAKYLTQLNPNKQAESLSLKRKNLGKNDELDNLVDAINTMHLNMFNLTKDLRENETLIRQLLDASDSPIYLFDTSDRCLLVNRYFCDLLGKSREEIVGHYRKEFMPIELASEHHNNDLRVLSSGENISLEESSLEADGQHYYISNKFPVRNGVGEIYAVGGISTDITPRIRAEQALQVSQSMLEAIYEAQISFIANPEPEPTFDILIENILKVTSSEFGFIGQVKYTAEEKPYLKMLVMSNFVPGNDRNALSEKNTIEGMEFHDLNNLFGKVILTGEPIISNNPETDTRSAGLPLEHAPIKCFLGLPFFHGEDLMGMIGIANRSDGYSAEIGQKIQPFLSTCASIIVAMQTEQLRISAEIEQERLRNQLLQSQKMESIGHLTGGIAHDFNNMLGVILGYADLSRQRIVQDLEMTREEILTYIDEILTAGNRAKQLIAQMLMYSRLSPDLDIKNTSAILLHPVVNEAVQLLRASIPSTIELSCEMDDNDIEACIQPVHLHQILLNLGINARDSIGNYGQITISIQKRELSGKCDSCHENFAGKFVEVAVRDTGSGITDEHIDKIFDPFFTTKEIGKGTGMGLPVVHGIVHSLGGHISVTREDNQSTTFSIYLPAAKENNGPLASVGETLQISSVSNAFDNLRIMVVDDEKSMGKLLGEFLTSSGAEVTVFANPVEALQVFDVDPFAIDMLITDESMPELSGFDMSKIMLSKRANLPILLCTGYSENVNETKARQAGIQGYMTKPVNFNQLMEWVQMHSPGVNSKT